MLAEQPADPKVSYPKAMDFLGSEPFHIMNMRSVISDPVSRAAELMEEAAIMERKPEWIDAAELWKSNRVMLPFYYTYKVTWSNDMKAERAKAIATLSTWQESFKGTESKAEAGYLTAWLMNQEHQFEGAVKQCKAVNKNLPRSYGSKNATN